MMASRGGSFIFGGVSTAWLRVRPSCTRRALPDFLGTLKRGKGAKDKSPHGSDMVLMMAASEGENPRETPLWAGPGPLWARDGTVRKEKGGGRPSAM